MKTDSHKGFPCPKSLRTPLAVIGVLKMSALRSWVSPRDRRKLPGRRVFRAAILSLIGLIAFCFVGTELVAQSVAFAVPVSVQHSTKYRVERNIRYLDGDTVTPVQEQMCQLDIYWPEDRGAIGHGALKEFDTVVWFHGGGLHSGQRSFPDALKEQNIAIVAVDYRLSPAAKSPAWLEDAASAVAWTLKHIPKYGGSSKRVFVAGHSAGGYLASMIGLDRRWLEAHDLDANELAGIASYSGHAITHFTVRAEQGIAKTQPVVDEMAPLFHVRADAPPLILITGDREKEMLGRYEEVAYLWRMMSVVGNRHCQIKELKGLNHTEMQIPAHQHLLNFVSASQTVSK